MCLKSTDLYRRYPTQIDYDTTNVHDGLCNIITVGIGFCCDLRANSWPAKSMCHAVRAIFTAHDQHVAEAESMTRCEGHECINVSQSLTAILVSGSSSLL